MNVNYAETCRDYYSPFVDPKDPKKCIYCLNLDETKLPQTVCLIKHNEDRKKMFLDSQNRQQKTLGDRY